MTRPGVPVRSVELLGSFTVRVDNAPIAAAHWRLRKARSLVAILALAPGQRRHREFVLDRLWPDLEPIAAAKNLHQTLYVARRALAGPGSPTMGLLAIRDEQVVLDTNGLVDVDVTRFESAARDALSTATIAALRAAAEAYAGDLLPDWPDADWLTSRRRELQDIQREVLVGLAAALQEGAPSEALVVLGRVLETDPLHEGAVRAQMAVLARLGRRSEALARYEQLVDDLLEAYGTDPDASTVTLFRGLLTGSPAQERHRKPPPALSDDDGPAPDVIDQLHRTRTRTGRHRAADGPGPTGHPHRHRRQRQDATRRGGGASGPFRLSGQGVVRGPDHRRRVRPGGRRGRGGARVGPRCRSGPDASAGAPPAPPTPADRARQLRASGRRL